MASKQDQLEVQCPSCQEELDCESKEFPCFHSFCRSCLDRHFEGQTNGNDQCPECHKPLTPDQLSRSPFLPMSLRRRQLESSSDWKCNWCLEDGIESIARNCCHDCQKLFCANCSNRHKGLHPKHNARDLGGMEKGEVIKAMTTHKCSLHQKAKEYYCRRCNMCLCDTCYKNHFADSPGCSSQPLSVREEASKQKSQGPTLAKEMLDLKMSLKLANERTSNYTEKLKLDCELKCRQLWKDYEDSMEKAKSKTSQLCEEMRKMMEEQANQWRHLLEENNKILKQLEIWWINLQNLLNESQQDVDVVCGLQSLKMKLSSRFSKLIVLKEKEMEVISSNWWLQFLAKMKSEEKIGSVYLAVDKLVFYKQWDLHRQDPIITSIHVSEEDDHVFLCDWNNKLLIEFTDRGEFVCECQLIHKKKTFHPRDMCSISPDMFAVACSEERKIIVLVRSKVTPFLKEKKCFGTEKEFCSLCEMKTCIFACDWNFQVDSFTEKGKKIKTIKTGESCDDRHLIRAGPSAEIFWGTRRGSSEIFCFDSNGEKLRTMKTAEKISDFCVNQNGDLYFCNKEGIFSLLQKKHLYKFEKPSEYHPKMFVLRKKIFVCLKINGNFLIQIFKIQY